MMETIVIENENTVSNRPKDCSTPKVSSLLTTNTSVSDRHERNTLHVLQDSSKGNVSPVNGKEPLERKKDKDDRPKVKILFDKGSVSVSSTQSVKIYEDSSSSDTDHKVRCSRSVQTEDLLLESYFENRQLHSANVSTDSGNLSQYLDQEAYDLMANESIPENYWKDLAEQRRVALNDTLEENEKLSFEIEHLKEENRRLSGIAQKAEHLEEILKEALADDSDEDSDKQDDSKAVSKHSSEKTDIAESEGATDTTSKEQSHK